MQFCLCDLVEISKILPLICCLVDDSLMEFHFHLASRPRLFTEGQCNLWLPWKMAWQDHRWSIYLLALPCCSAQVSWVRQLPMPSPALPPPTLSWTASTPRWALYRPQLPATPHLPPPSGPVHWPAPKVFWLVSFNVCVFKEKNGFFVHVESLHWNLKQCVVNFLKLGS